LRYVKKTTGGVKLTPPSRNRVKGTAKENEMGYRMKPENLFNTTNFIHKTGTSD